MYKTYFLIRKFYECAKFVIPVTVPSITLPTSIVMLFQFPPCDIQHS